MTTTKHPQHRNSKRRNRAKRAAKKWAPATSPAERAAAKTAAERVAAKTAAERVAAEQAAAAFNPPEQAQRRKSLACRFGWHHWESKRAEAQRFRECTQCGRHRYYGWYGDGGGRDEQGDDDESWRLHDPGAGHAGNWGWFDWGDGGLGGDGGDGGYGGDGGWE
jgi:hypothetical protein